MLIVLATAIAFTACMLGILLNPAPAVIIGLTLVVLGVTVLVPRERRIMAGIIGGIAVVVGGVAIPRFLLTHRGYE